MCSKAHYPLLNMHDNIFHFQSNLERICVWPFSISLGCLRVICWDSRNSTHYQTENSSVQTACKTNVLYLLLFPNVALYALQPFCYLVLILNCLEAQYQLGILLFDIQYLCTVTQLDWTSMCMAYFIGILTLNSSVSIQLLYLFVCTVHVLIWFYSLSFTCVPLYLGYFTGWC